MNAVIETIKKILSIFYTPFYHYYCFIILSCKNMNTHFLPTLLRPLISTYGRKVRIVFVDIKHVLVVLSPANSSYRNLCFAILKPPHNIFFTYGIFRISQAMPKQSGTPITAARQNFSCGCVCKPGSARIRKTMTGTWMTYTAKECWERNRPNFFPPSRKRRKKVINARLIPTAKIESHRANTADCQLP